MLSMVLYGCGCVVLSIIITVILLLFRPMTKRHETNSPVVLFAIFALCGSFPFMYSEGLTKMHGKDIEKALVAAYEADIPIKGEMLYYKITSFRNGKAKAIVVGEEREDWGGTDRPIASITFEKHGTDWKATDYALLHSSRLGKDSIIFPPYR